MRDAFEVLVWFGSFFGTWYWIASRFPRHRRWIGRLVGLPVGVIASFVVVAACLSLGIFKQADTDPGSLPQPASETSLAIASEDATRPQQFGSVGEMIENRADFSEELGTFKVITANPLHIQLAAQVVRNDLPEVVLSEVRRAAIYGVYRTLIHTSVDKVRVTAVPMEITLNPRSSRLLKSPVVDIEVTRAQALEAVASKMPARSLNDLVELTPDSDSWTMSFAELYFKPEGQAVLVKALSHPN